MAMMMSQLFILVLFQPHLIFLNAGAARHHDGLVPLLSQQAALLHWKSTLRSSPPALDSWRPGTSPCTGNWTGVACGGVRHRHRASSLTTAVTNISLPSIGVDGSLGELNFSALPSLTYLDLSFNNLRGEIPAAITSLSELSYLDLSGNSLHGQIPWEMGSMRSLAQLGLSFNNLTGHIPESLGNLTKMAVLVIHQNALTGAIPEKLGRLTGLETLGLSSTLLSGSIPESLGNLSRPSSLDLYRSNLSGPIPSSLGNLINLLDLELSNNR